MLQSNLTADMVRQALSLSDRSYQLEDESTGRMARVPSPREEAIADLRRNVSMPPSQPRSEDITSNTAGGVPISMPGRRGLRVGVIAVGVVLLLGALGVGLSLRAPASTPAAASASPQSDTVNIEITTQPALAAKIVLGDQELTGPSATASVKRSASVPKSSMTRSGSITLP